MSSRSNPKGGLRARRGDAGFTMIEVLVALTILATMAASMIPVLVTGIRASQKARLETQAKNITQQRIEAMRGLPFHVDRQNGPFLDLLDVYYTDLSTATTTRAIGGETSKANWISNAPGTGGLPSGPAYHVSYPSIPGYPSFTQDVYTQFLRTTHTLATVPAGYTSQVVGSDDPPALLFGVTVITSWTSGQSARSYRTYTEIADGRTSVALITTQAHSVFLRAVSTAADGTTYEGHVGDVQADGSLTSGSLANVQAASGYFELTNQPRVAGAIGSAVAPPNPAGSVASSVAAQVKAPGSGPCGWGSLGKTQYDDVSADTAQGWPSAPSDAGTDATSATAPKSRSGLLANGGGCDGWAFYYRNSDTTTTYPAQYSLKSGAPLVGIEDTGGSGYLASASGAITATNLLTVPHTSSARAAVKAVAPVAILPTTFAEHGLVTVKLTSASLACVSGQAVSGSYSLSVSYPGGSKSVTFTSGTPFTNPLPDPSTISFWTGSRTALLSEYLTWEVAGGLSTGNSGINSLGPIMRIAISPDVVGNGGINVEIGNLSCAADDSR